MASRGRQTLVFGPMKPVGLEDPKTGKTPYAVVQLRQDDAMNFIQYRRFPNSFKVGTAKRSATVNSGIGKCRDCTLWCNAS